MSTTTIKPTVGRVVWFYPAANQASAGFHAPTLNDPLAAIVAKVIGERMLNLAVFDAHGFSHSMIDVPLLQEGEKAPEGGRYATWMPYQIGQAKKAEDREHQEKQLAVAADRAVETSGLRAHALEMALRTPGLSNHSEVLAAAKAYQAHIEGENTLPAPTIETKTYSDGTTSTGTAPLPAISPNGAPALPPHQQRVIDEKRELDERLAKLRAFLDTDTCRSLDSLEQQRLGRQEMAMARYSEILGERIAAFAPVHDSDCAQHNEPAEPNGPCDCGLSRAGTPT